jgi:cellobiose-specific phosphotransferase system component IIA
MEMMDIRAAIRWLNESSDLMTMIVKSLESQPKGEMEFLKRELVAAQRVLIEAALNNSVIVAKLLSDQVILELPLLMGHAEDYLTLVKAQTRYREESNKACAVLKKIAAVNPTAPAASQAPKLRTPEDLKKRMEELMAKSSPIAANPAVTTSTADDSASSMPSEAPVDAAHIIVDENANQTAERSD